MRRFLIPGVILAAAVAVLALLTFGVSNNPDSSSIDAQVAAGHFPRAPNSDETLPVLGASGRKSLAAFRGKVVVLNMFASWCDPCQTEAPILAAEQPILARHDATLVGVTYEDNPDASEQFAHRYHLTFPVLRDVNGDLASAYGVNGVPETFVINRSGRIQALRREPITKQWLQQTLPRILSEAS